MNLNTFGNISTIEVISYSKNILCYISIHFTLEYYTTDTQTKIFSK